MLLYNLHKKMNASFHCSLPFMFFSLLIQRKERKETMPREKPFPRSLHVFRELQNSHAFGMLKQAAILFPKIPRSLGAFQGDTR